MNRLISLLVTLLVFLFSGAASAFEVDFTAGIKKLDPAAPSFSRLVVNSNFKDSGLAEFGNFTIYYDVTEAFTGNIVFSDSLTISSDETQLLVGNANAGKITMIYDPITDLLKTRFVIKLTQATQYNISASDGLWSGRSTLISGNTL